MPYANNWKLGNGSTVTLGSNGPILDATKISFPSEERGLVDITTLGSTRKEYLASDMPDSPEIGITVSHTGLTGSSLVTGTVVSCSISFAKITKTISFSGIITKAGGGEATPDGKVAFEISVKPTTAYTVA